MTSRTPVVTVLALSALLTVQTPAQAQGPGTENGQWTYLGGDAWHTRYTTADQIDASNFEQLKLAWQFDASSFGPTTSRATGSYIDGKLITVAGDRRHVLALDPTSGELLWSFTEPNSHRWEYSMRAGYGKGVAYGEIDGRGVVYISTPGFFLHALDAETGVPLENWGRPVPLIQALVINKSSKRPGAGFAIFAPDEKDFDQATWRRLRDEVWDFPDWGEVLDALELSRAVVELPPVDEISAHGGGGEGAEHKRLKEAVSVNPQWSGLPNSLSPGKVEASLYSGDSLDVLFSDSNRRIAVEVKGASAPVGEVIRGLFQCVKYEAVLDAEARVAGSRADCEAVLALGGSFPGELTPLRHTLGVRVFENLG